MFLLSRNPTVRTHPGAGPAAADIADEVIRTEEALFEIKDKNNGMRRTLQRAVKCTKTPEICLNVHVSVWTFASRSSWKQNHKDPQGEQGLHDSDITVVRWETNSYGFINKKKDVLM